MDRFIDWILDLGFLGKFGVIFGALFGLIVLWIVWVQVSDSWASRPKHRKSKKRKGLPQDVLVAALRGDDFYIRKDNSPKSKD